MNQRYYIGGGIIAAVLGISPFATPLDAYYSITAEREMPVGDEKQKFFNRRKALEPFAAECFKLQTGREIIARNIRYQDNGYDWARAEIDFETDDGHNGECKTVRSEARWLWEDNALEPPMYVTAQCMWGLGITGKELCYVHRFEMDSDTIYLVRRDDDVIKDIRDRARHFWMHHVEKRRPPAPINVDDILKLYGRGTERKVEADTDVCAALSVRAEAKLMETINDAKIAKSEFVIKGFMRDASVLTVGGKVVATWKTDSRGIRKFLTK